MTVINKQGLAKFARPEQVLYQRGSAIITSYLGEALRNEITEGNYLDKYNFTVAELFLLAIKFITPKKSLTNKHIYFNVDNNLKEKLFLTNAQEKSMDQTAKIAWYQENLYCMQIADEGDEYTKYALMYKHLNNCFHERFGINGRLASKNIQCFALTRISKKDRPQTLETASLSADFVGVNNGKLSDFVYAVNSSRDNLLEFPVIDETDYSSNISIRVSSDLLDIKVINNELEKINLQLIEAVRAVKMVVIESTAENYDQAVANSS